MGDAGLKDAKLEPGLDPYQLECQSRAQKLPKDQNQKSSSFDKVLNAQSFNDNNKANPSVSHLCPAPICRQFWKSGDYQPIVAAKSSIHWNNNYLHVHPRFLHTNATSHKWAFGAVAELLDNAIDEIQNGATFVIVDKISNPRDGNPALLIQDDGSGMNPDIIRKCMSFGFSDKKSKSAIGQYGNGFKTSTMRLGADVIVFSRHMGNRTVTRSVGLLSYTYLTHMGLDRIVVPLVDYELNKLTGKFEPLQHYDAEQITYNISILLKWSPYSTEVELLKQFDDIGDHGTKIVIYNLWQTDEGKLEFDFNTNPEDIRLNDAKSEAASHYKLTISEEHIGYQFRYSLRVYLSILYLRIPENFQILLRGEVVIHHNLADDLKYIEYILYKPQTGGTVEGQVVTTIGFLKEAPHVNIHGFNVYHKNRLILPFWQVVSYQVSRGRGVVGILEANFVQPTHNKQDFEKTSLFQKLECRLKQMTWEYWDYHCGLIGYRVTKNLSSQNSSAIAMKRLPQDLPAESPTVKRRLANGAGAVGGYSAVAPSINQPNIKETVLRENRSLRERCKQHEKTMQELNDEVARLKAELTGVQREYATMFEELKLCDLIKSEKTGRSNG